MQVPEILRLPNLVSMSRIAMIPLLWYFLAGSGQSAMFWAAVVMIAAGVSDGLDGWLARRMNLVTPLGIALDPIADKVFAGAMVILLIFYREFPVWLASIIIGRDLLILLAGLVLLRGRDITLPSNLTGKYAFTAIAVLLGSYVIRFPFGIELFTWLTIALVAASTFSYGRVFVFVRQGERPPQFNDRRAYRVMRIVVTLGIALLYFVRLYGHLFA